MALNRKALRNDLETKLKAALPTATVYTYLPKSLKGQSPIITIESGRSMPTSTPEEPGWVGITVGLWTLRTDAETAEDQFDDFTDDFIAAIEESYNVMWSTPTEPGYEVDEGKLYRVEWHELSLEWW